MISYFKYDNGNAFTLNGLDYVGYFHVINGIAYSGKPQDLNSQQLSAKDTYLSELYLKQAKFDGRQIDLDLELPNALDILDETTLSRYFEKISQNNSIIYNSNLFINPNIGGFTYGSTIFYTLTSSPIDERPSDGKIYGRNVYTHSDPFSATPQWAFLDNIKSGYFTIIDGGNGFAYYCNDGVNQYTLSGSYTAGSTLELLNTTPVLSSIALIADYGSDELFEISQDSIKIYDISNYGVCNTKTLKDSIETIVDANYANLYKIGKDKRTEFKNNTLYIKNKYSNELYSSYPLAALDLDTIIALDIRKEDDNIILIGQKGSTYLFVFFDVDNFNATFSKTILEGLGEIIDLQFSSEDSDIFEIWQKGYDLNFYSQYRAIDRPDIPVSETGEASSLTYRYIKTYKFDTTNEKFEEIQIKFNSNKLKSNSFNGILQMTRQQDGYLYDITHNIGRIYVTKSSRSFFTATIPQNVSKTYTGIECSDSGAGISFNASLINLIRDTINLATLSQKTKGQSASTSEILSLAEPIEKLTIDMENLRLNGNETFSEIAIRRIFNQIYTIQSKIYKYSILAPEKPTNIIPPIVNDPIEIETVVEEVTPPPAVTSPLTGTSVYDPTCIPSEINVIFGYTSPSLNRPRSGANTNVALPETRIFGGIDDSTFVGKFDGNGYAIYNGNGMWMRRCDIFAGAPTNMRLEYINNRWVIKINDELWMTSYYIEGQQNGTNKCNPLCRFTLPSSLSITGSRQEIETRLTTTPLEARYFNTQPIASIPAIGPASVKVSLAVPNKQPQKICAKYYSKYSGYLLYARNNKGVDYSSGLTSTTVFYFLVLRFVGDSWVIEEDYDIVSTPPPQYYVNGKLKVGKVDVNFTGVSQDEINSFRNDLAVNQGFGSDIYAGAPDQVRDYLNKQERERAKAEAIRAAESEAYAKWLPDKSKKFNSYNNQTTPYNLQFIKYKSNPFIITTFEADDECIDLPNVLISL